MQVDAARPKWLGFVSGVVAGGSGVLAGHAFDTMKVQAQVAGSSAGSSVKTNAGFSLSSIIILYRCHASAHE